MMIVLRRKQARETTGTVAAFLLLAGWMNLLHFMYYDTLLAALPIFVLLTEPRRLTGADLAGRGAGRARAPGGGPAALLGPHLPREYPSEVPLLQAKHRTSWCSTARRRPCWRSCC